EGDGPEDGAQRVVDEENPIGHAGGAGHEGHQRTCKPDEPAHQDRLPALAGKEGVRADEVLLPQPEAGPEAEQPGTPQPVAELVTEVVAQRGNRLGRAWLLRLDRKSTRLNSSHEWISYAVFVLKKKR